MTDSSRPERLPQNRLPRLVWFCWYGLSASLTAYFLADATSRFFIEPEVLLSRKAVVSASSVGDRYAQRISADAVLRRNLMQLLPLPGAEIDDAPQQTKSSPKQADPVDSLDAIPISTRGWQLLGTVASSVPLESHAAIVAEGKQTLVREGEFLQGWLVERVTRKQAVLRKDNIRERLILHVPADKGTSPTAGAEASSGGVSARAAMTPGSFDPVSLMRDISLRPKASGTGQGMEITTLIATSPLYALGLRTGDVVLSVNGKPFRSYDDLPGLLGTLGSGTLTIRLLRQGQERVLP